MFIKDFLLIGTAIVALHRAAYRGEYTMFGGSSSPSGNTTTTTNTTPWTGQQPYLQNVFASAQNLYNNPSDYPQVYPGATSGSETAPFSPLQAQAYDTIGQTGLNSSLMNTDAQVQQNILNGSNLSAGNPYQQAELQSLNSQITPALESQFTQGNSMNNPAAAFATAQGIGSADANILGQNYNTALNQQTQESLYAPNTYQNILQGQEAAATAGGAQQTQSQDVLNGMINAYNYNQQLPFQMLNQFAGNVQGTYGGNTTATQPYYNNTAQTLFGDATQLGGLGLLGYMALSDRRLKKNIQRIEKLISGISVYSFEYLWGGKYIGCMADEVEKVIPQAVGNLLGFKTVNYSMVA